MRQSGSDEEIYNENPRQKANCFSAITFWYSLRLFKQGINRELDENDLTHPLDEHKSQILGEKLAKIWTKEYSNALKERKQPSIGWVILKAFYSDILIYGFILMVLELVVRLLQPLFIGLFIRYFCAANRDNNEPLRSPMYIERIYHFWTPNQSPIQKGEACFFAGGVMLFSLVVIMTIHPYMMAALHVGMKIRVACCSLIYRKALRIKLSSVGGNTVGNAVNLMSNDVNRFDIVPMFIHYLWIAPIQAILCTYFIYLRVGFAAIVGISAIMAFMPLQVILGLRTSQLRRKAAVRTDDRVRQMNEIIQAMQVIKMYAWEDAFADLICVLRKREISILRQTCYIKGIIMSFIMFTVRTCIFLTVLSIVLSNVEVTAENVFLIISYYQILRETMTVYFPQGIAMLAETLVSISRIQKFMLTEETHIGDPTSLDPAKKHKLRIVLNTERQPLKPTETSYINIVHGMAIYQDNICLEDINLRVLPGELTTVVGQVGSGKSCLLNLILGELPLFSGTLQVKGTVSFASQEPWLFAGSIRQNILFGREFELQRYRDVVRVCALSRDFMLLPFGDRSIVGERGISLSGGQRARVNLARAVYKKADAYLLDDPLSAVDIHVGQQLFDNCIKGFLGNKVVILVTHQLQYLKKASQILLLQDGMIKGKGTYEELIGTGSDFAHLLEEQESFAVATDESDVDLIMRAVSITSAAFNSMIDIEGLKKRPEVLGEIRTIGSVGSKIYKEYFLAGTNCLGVLIMLLFYLMAQTGASTTDFFLSKWVNIEELRNHFGHAEEMGGYNNLSRNGCIFIYLMLILATTVIAISRSIIFFTICMRSSVKLHDMMFKRIICASMRFFNINTSGRILNRFSKDLGAVDELLPYAFIDTVQFMLNVVGTIVLVSLIQVYILIPTCIMLVLFYILRRIYLKTSRNVKRLEGITRSPVFAHLNATLQGLATIRSNGAEHVLVKEFDKLQDIHSSAWFMFLYTSRAFGLWLDLICTLYIGLVAFSFVFFSDTVTGSDVGLAITQCIGLNGFIQWGLRQSAELENQMTSVERVLEFTKIELEPDLKSAPDRKPPSAWPRHGKIEFVQTTMRYAPNDPPVLKNINLIIYPMEKVGIVGRTGAGKSSLISALFRLTAVRGHILVDNLDISVVGIHDLRKKISIIPQEPVLFSGTLRYNLDPFNEQDDDTILATLVDVEVKTAMIYGRECLNFVVTEGGTNISIGERQMVCLVRAILRNNKILIMDEATANVDSVTDRFIQSIIRRKFANCTVLTIAHRLHTIMDSDKVLVMDAGCVAEYNHPHVLLQNTEGILYDMVRNTGPGMAEVLTRIAKESRLTVYNAIHDPGNLATVYAIL